MESKTEWVLDGAMSGKSLQSGGTFHNVLSRKLDEVITPFFAEVLVCGVCGIRSVHQVTHKQSSVEYKVSCV